jgi:hypothetical protein
MRRAQKRNVYAQYIVGFRNLLQPDFDLGRLARILLTRDLDPSLNLADRRNGETQILVGNAFNPSENGTMRANSAQLNIGVRRVCEAHAAVFRLVAKRSALLARDWPTATPSAWGLAACCSLCRS